MLTVNLGEGPYPLPLRYTLPPSPQVYPTSSPVVYATPPLRYTLPLPLRYTLRPSPQVYPTLPSGIPYPFPSGIPYPFLSGIPYPFPQVYLPLPLRYTLPLPQVYPTPPLRYTLPPPLTYTLHPTPQVCPTSSPHLYTTPSP